MYKDNKEYVWWKWKIKVLNVPTGDVKSKKQTISHSFPISLQSSNWKKGYEGKVLN